LQLDFDIEVGVFYCGDEAIDEARRDQFLNENLDPISHEWIVDLVEHKLDYLKSLREVYFRLVDR
jgi:hypothetical protein